MASSRIDVNVNGKDNTAAAFNSVGKHINGLKKEAASAGQTIGQAISQGAAIASAAASKMSASFSNAFGMIKAGAAGAKQSIGDMGSAIASLTAGFGAIEVASSMLGGAMTKQFTQAELAMKVGNDRAKELAGTISQIVAETPGDDTYMNQLLGGMVAKQQSLSNAELRTAGFLASDYIIKSRSVGKTMLETQMDLKEYLMTGNTGQLERDSILKMQLDTLKGQGTVSERILALDKAMKAEGYEGLSQLDVMQIKWDTLKGKIQLAATTIGERILPPLQKIVEFFLDLDTRTQGWSSILAVAAFSIVTIGIALGPVVAATISAYAAMKLYRIEAEKAAGVVPGIGKGLTMGTVTGTVGSLLLTVGVATIVAVGAWKFADEVINSLDKFFYGVTTKEKEQLTEEEKLRRIREKGASLDKQVIDAWNKAWATAGENLKQFGETYGPALDYIRGAWGNTMKFLQDSWNAVVGPIISGWNWISSIARGSIQWIIDKWNELKSTVQKGVSGAVNILWGPIQTAIDKFWELYNTVKNNPIVQKIITVASSGASAVSNVVSTVSSAATSAWNWLTGARGPGDVEYQDYPGYTGKNPWQDDGTLAGNCVDMSVGLVSRFGGSLVNGTWNGGLHTWWKAPDGKEYDPSRKALSGTWSPPGARGPGDGGSQINIYGDVYGYDDFAKKVEQANNRIVVGVF